MDIHARAVIILPMKVLVVGAGRIGRCAAHDCARWADEVLVCDSSTQAIESFPGGKNTKTYVTKSSRDIAVLLKKSDIVVSCIPYFLNFELTRACIRYSRSMVDLGGNTDFVMKQLALHPKAKKKGITIVPDCGLSPGITNVLAGDLARRGYAREILIRVGGLPQNPVPPMNYEFVFSVEGLLNEYVSDVVVLEKGRVKLTKPLTAVEELDFNGILKLAGIRDSVGFPLEAGATSGGSSTLPHTFEGVVRTMNDKSIRVRGHYAMLRKTRKEKMREFLLQNISESRNDMVLMSVIGSNGKKSAGYASIHRKNGKFSAMMETTGYGATVIAEMIMNGTIRERGVLKQEIYVDAEKFIEGLDKRGVAIKRFEVEK